MTMTDAPLTDAEAERLEAFLDGCGPDAMNLEMLDGFFAALISGPDPVPPSEYLPEVWGAPVFQDADEAAAMTGLLTRHWNTIASALLCTLEHDEVYEAWIYEDEQGHLLGNDWAYGFMRGVDLRIDGWQALLPQEDGESDSLLSPMLWLVHEHDDDPAFRPPPVTGDERDEIVAMMVSSLTLIYRHFAPRRRMGGAALKPVRRTGPKVGRNDPCPCGSGRKFKHCCGQGGGTVIH